MGLAPKPNGSNGVDAPKRFCGERGSSLAACDLALCDGKAGLRSGGFGSVVWARAGGRVGRMADEIGATVIDGAGSIGAGDIGAVLSVSTDGMRTET